MRCLPPLARLHGGESRHLTGRLHSWADAKDLRPRVGFWLRLPVEVEEWEGDFAKPLNAGRFSGMKH